jgi:excisionase family DNA binding protein
MKSQIGRIQLARQKIEQCSHSVTRAIQTAHHHRRFLMAASIEPLIYHVSDVARLLGCKVSSARRLLEQGVIPSRRLGRKLIVLPDELETHLKKLPNGNATAQRDGWPG